MILFCLAAVLLAGSTGPARRSEPTATGADHIGHRSNPTSHVAWAAPADAGEAALRLQSLLGQHSMLASDLMRGRIRSDENFAQAADAALGKNTAGMAQLVQSLFGADAARQFETMWGGHVVAVVNYARGLVDQDRAVQEQARDTLTEFERDLGTFFAGASQGRLSEDAAHHALLTHIEHLLSQADAYAARDYATANRIYREAYRHTYDLGRTLAVTLLPSGAAAALEEPSWRLRSELGKLLAEHVGLAVDASRAAIADSGDFTAAAAAINGNTRDLAAAVDTLFGRAAARDFQRMWAEHVDSLMAYMGGTAVADEKRRQEARAELAEYERELAGFLAAATERRLDSGTLTEALVAHDAMLMQHADAFAARDYQTAHQTAYSTFEHMTGLAGQLADAFGETVAKRLPVGGAATGLGGMAAQVGR